MDRRPFGIVSKFADTSGGLEERQAVCSFAHLSAFLAFICSFSCCQYRRKELVDSWELLRNIVGEENVDKEGYLSPPPPSPLLLLLSLSRSSLFLVSSPPSSSRVIPGLTSIIPLVSASIPFSPLIPNQKLSQRTIGRTSLRLHSHHSRPKTAIPGGRAQVLGETVCCRDG